MLTGSDSERMSRWKLDQLSTYGILRDSGFTQKEVTDIIDALARARLVETQDVDRFKPVITLTEAGWSWLKDRDGAELILDLPDEPAPANPLRGYHAAGPGAGPGRAPPRPCPPVQGSPRRPCPGAASREAGGGGPLRRSAPGSAQVAAIRLGPRTETAGLLHLHE